MAESKQPRALENFKAKTIKIQIFCQLKFLKIFQTHHFRNTLICCLDRANGDCILMKMLHYYFTVHTAQNEASIQKIS